MSIWSSHPGDPVVALANDAAANYRGEGEPSVNVDVATALTHHRLIRLALWDDDIEGVDAEVLLSGAAARALAARLVQAADLVEGGA